MSTTRQSYVQREIRGELRRFLTAARGLIVKTVALMAAVCAVPVLLHSPAYFVGLIHGVVLVATPAIVTAGFLLSGDSALLIAGAYSESFTREEVAVAIKRGYVHRAVHNIEAGPPTDVDHLLLTPAGAIALESKRRFCGASDHWLMGAVAQTRAAGRKASSVMISKHVGQRMAVRAVLVVWGGAQRELPQHSIVDGVDVVRGQDLTNWLQQFAHGDLGHTQAAHLHGLLEAFARTRQPAASRRHR